MTMPSSSVEPSAGIRWGSSRFVTPMPWPPWCGKLPPGWRESMAAATCAKTSEQRTPGRSMLAASSRISRIETRTAAASSFSPTMNVRAVSPQ